jgi:hypothetical protein
MKIAITGHTGGLGLAFFNYFSKSHEVIGLSRSNGYTLPSDLDKVVGVVKNCDLFFNNAHIGTAQASLIQELYSDVPIITSGSMAANYTGKQYFDDKRYIEDVFKAYKSHHPKLLLKMGYLENYQDRNSIAYCEVINAVKCWINNPRITTIEFENV